MAPKFPSLLAKPKLMSLCLVLLVIYAPISSSSKIVRTLPGYSGELPFTLETGYIGVGDNEEVQLFYYFVESQRSPSQDPLLLYIAGGPGCSGLCAFFSENGPLSFNFENYNGSLPTLNDNKFAWTQGLNILYLDAPVGTGFSYSKTQQGYLMDDYKFVAQSYEFLLKWLVEHPMFLENVFYVGGVSYAGIPVPMIIQRIIDGNGNGTEPFVNINGYVLAGPVTDNYIDENARIPYAHRLTLISDQIYKAAKTSCGGDYVNVDPSNEACLTDIGVIDELIRDINLMNILEPYCSYSLPSPKDISRAFVGSPTSGALWCRQYEYMIAAVWANNKGVQDALGVRKGTKSIWQFCNSTLAYTKEVTSVLSYHQNFTKDNLRGLIYSGDHDMLIPHIGTQKWINSLNLSVEESWRVWSVDGQTAGYTKKLSGDDFTLTFVTVKGAGHVAAEYNTKDCSKMIERWLAYYPV